MQNSTIFRALLCLFVVLATAVAALAENPKYRISVTRGGTPLGDIVVELFQDVAPQHVHNFDSLVSIGFYDGTAFHRVIPGFMIQGGDPNSRSGPRDTWGYGAAGQTTVPAEFSTISHKRGILSAARVSGNINSATSQFFICVAPATHLDGQYSVYGEVVEGMDIVDVIVQSPRDARDNPNEKVEMAIEKMIPSSVEQSAAAQGMQLATQPNPASDELLIRCSPARSGSIRYSLYNSVGTEVKTATIEQPAGSELLHVDISALPPGSYYCRLYTGTTVESGSFVVVK